MIDFLLRQLARPSRQSLPPALVLVLCLVTPLRTLLGQPNEFAFKQLTVADGLSQGNVQCIFQDSRGFMWFGTLDGLNRYDGYEFRRFYPDDADSNSLSHNIITAITESANRVLWIGNARGTLDRMDLSTGRIQRWALPQTPAPLSAARHAVSMLYCDSHRNLWVGTSGSGLFRMSASSLSFDRVPLDNDGSGRSIVGIDEDAHGRVWVATRSHGLFVLDADGRIVGRAQWTSRTDPALQIYGFLLGRPGIGYVRSYSRVWSFPTDAIGLDQRGRPLVVPDASPSLYLSALQPGSMAIDSSGRLWVSDFKDVMVFDADLRSVARLRNDPIDPLTIASGYLQSMYTDEAGCVWTGWSGSGISRLSPASARFGILRYPFDISSQSVRAIYEDRSGNVWVGGYGVGISPKLGTRAFAGLDILDAALHRFKQNPLGSTSPFDYPGDNVYGFLEDPADQGRTLWIFSDGGTLYRYDVATQRYSRAPGYRSKVVGYRALYRDTDGRLWAGTATGLLDLSAVTLSAARVALDPEHSHVRAMEALHGLPVLDIASLRGTQGILWCATAVGLVAYQPSTGIARLYARERRSGDSPATVTSVTSIYQDGRGRIWVTTNGSGFAQFFIGTPGSDGFPSPDSSQFVWHTTVEGLPNNVVYGVLEDTTGHLWMSTNKGLTRFSPNDGSYRNYSAADGLQSNEFNRNAFLVARNGTMFFGGVGGLTHFVPEHVHDNASKPRLAITGFLVFKVPLDLPRPIEELQEVELSYDQNSVDIEYVGLEYMAPENNRYRYQLVGHDEGWIDAGRSRVATYTNLEPAEYEFRVVASNNDGVWNEEPKTLRIVVAPPVWRTLWFRGIAAVTVVGLLWGFVTWRTGAAKRQRAILEREVHERTKALEDANSELEAFTYSVSHDLRSPLRAIEGHVKIIQEDAGPSMTAETLQVFSVIARNALRMSRLIDDLLALSRVGRTSITRKPVDMRSIVDAVVADVVRTDAARIIELRIGPLPVTHADGALMRQVWENLISNAVKFTSRCPQPLIEIGGATTDNAESYWIRDNGAGFDMAYRAKLFNVFERLHTEAEYPGTGIGLSIVHRIVKRHGGAVEAEGSPGIGARFSFSIRHDEGSFSS